MRTDPPGAERFPLNRRSLLVGAAAASLGAMLPRTGEAAAPPNVLFISVDDLNDWIEPLGGHPNVITPAFSRLAAMGVNFRRAYCPAPVCGASRTAVLTGVPPAKSGVYDNDPPLRVKLPDAVTIPQAFRAAGYRVVGGGKVFHGAFAYPPFAKQTELAPWLDLTPGAATWDDYLTFSSEPIPAARPGAGFDLKAGGQFDWGVPTADEEDYPDIRLARFAADQLRRPHDRPLFLAVGLYRPHLAWYLPQRFFDLYPRDRVTLPEVLPNDLDDVPPAGRNFTSPNLHKLITENNLWPDAVRAYLASISFSDHALGLVLDALQDGPHASNTIVVLWSDNGWHLGEKMQWRKFTLWEEATRVPFLIAGPGIAGNRVCDHPVNLLDIYHTLGNLCGVTVPPEAQGHSLTPLLDDPNAAWPHPSVTTWLEGNHSVRLRNWRYTRYRDGGEELYDLTQDPHEWTNLAGRPEHTTVKVELASHLPTS